MNRNNYVISQHLLQEPRRIDDLPGQVFMPGMEPAAEPVQANMFCPYCGGTGIDPENMKPCPDCQEPDPEPVQAELFSDPKKDPRNFRLYNALPGPTCSNCTTDDKDDMLQQHPSELWSKCHKCLYPAAEQAQLERKRAKHLGLLY